MKRHTKTKLRSTKQRHHTLKEGQDYGDPGLAAAVALIVNHPDTPTDLNNAIRDCITHYTNLEDSQGDSLVERWTYHPDTIAACLKWAIEAEDKRKAAEELEARTVPRGPK